MCGGTADAVRAAHPEWGLSPRVRGNLDDGGGLLVYGGSIPACAGEPGLRWASTIGGGVYPRVCGGTLAADAAQASEAGLSPRVRGNPAAAAPESSKPGSIPARAGEPVKDAIAKREAGVYPRVCGGTSGAFG